MREGTDSFCSQGPIIENFFTAFIFVYSKSKTIFRGSCEICIHRLYVCINNHENGGIKLKITEGL
jgi:hypothetical protein